MRLPLIPPVSTKDGTSNKNSRMTNMLKESRKDGGDLAVVRPGLEASLATTGNGNGLIAFNNELISLYGSTVNRIVDVMGWALGSDALGRGPRLAYGNGVFIINGQYSINPASSPDGLVWSSITAPFGGNMYTLLFANGLFITSDYTTNTIAWSTNGAAWTLGTNLPAGWPWTSFAYGDGVFVGVQSGSNVAASSTNGKAWTARTLPTSGSWASVAYGGGVFVAIRASSTSGATSSNGTSWSTQAVPRSDLIAVGYGNGTFIAVGTTNNYCYSYDGATWHSSTLPDSSYNNVQYVNGYWYAVGSNGKCAVSADGLAWQSVPFASSDGYYSVASDGIITVGANDGPYVSYDTTGAQLVALPYTLNDSRYDFAQSPL